MMAWYVLHVLCLILFICGLIQECVNSQDYIESSDRMIMKEVALG